MNAHAALFAKTKIYLPDEVQILKRPDFTTPDALEVGDKVVAVIEDTKIEGTYQGGDQLLRSSYSIDIENEF